MKLEFKRCDYAKISAAPAKRPLKVGIIRRTGPSEVAIGGHYIRGQHIVDGQTKFAPKAAESAAQCQAPNTGMRYRPRSSGKAVRQGFEIQFAQQAATGYPRSASLWVNTNPAHF